MPITETDKALVFAAKNGNNKCFEELYRCYYDKIYALAKTTVKNSEDAEDILQMTFIKAWQCIGGLADPAAFGTWLQRITLNQCYSLLRSRKPQQSVDDEGENGEIMQLESDLMLPEQYAERSDLSARLQSIIDELSAVQRETIMLYYFNGMTVEEIARTMDCSEGTVKSRLFLARKMLKTEIEEQERKSGQKFYSAGAALIPFAGLFVRLVRSSLIPESRAMDIFGGITRAVFNPQSAAVQALHGASGQTPNSARPVQSPVQQGGLPGSSSGHGAVSSVGSGAKAASSGSAAAKAVSSAASTAAKAGFPLWAKITACVAAAAIAVTGATVGISSAIRRSSAKRYDASSVAGVIAADEQKQLINVDPSEMPDSLDSFLQYLDWGYRDRLGGMEFDSGNPNSFDMLIADIARNGSCVDLSLYPGGETEENWDERDPLGKYEEPSCITFGEDKVLWVTENVFNISSSEAVSLLQSTLAKDKYLYEFDDNGEKRLCNYLGDIGGPWYEISYDTVKTDGERYYVIYKSRLEGAEESEYENIYYAELEERTLDGMSFWSIYRHTSSLPNLNNITVPEGYNDAYRAYISELEEKYGAIFGAEVHDKTDTVSLTDVYGDQTPELIFWESEDGGYSYKKYLNIITYENGAVRSLFRNNEDDYIAQSALFKTEQSKRLYLLDNMPGADTVYTTVYSFDETADGLSRNETVHYSAIYNMDDINDPHYDYSWRVNGADSDEEDYASGLASLMDSAAEVVMMDDVYNTDTDRLKTLNNIGLTVDEALERLYEAIGEKRPAESEGDIFARFAGEYTFTSGIGGWGTKMTIRPDGSFSGEYSDSDYVAGDGYEVMKMESVFSGRFTNPKRVNGFTYSFNIEYIEYENEPGLKEIKTLYGSERTQITYTTAYGLDNISGRILAFAPETYKYSLPDKMLSWIEPFTEYDGYTPELGYSCLYEPDGKFGWLGPRDNG